MPTDPTPNAVVWRLHCKRCGRAIDEAQSMYDVQQHMITEHAADVVTLDLVPHCPVDDAAYELSQSGDSGQCPACGRFDILRIPEEYR